MGHTRLSTEKTFEMTRTVRPSWRSSLLSDWPICGNVPIAARALTEPVGGSDGPHRIHLHGSTSAHVRTVGIGNCTKKASLISLSSRLNGMRSYLARVVLIRHLEKEAK